MEKKEITLPDGKKVNIWRLNYGFRTDMQGASAKMKDGKNPEVNIGTAQVMTLVYGIWDSEDLGIKQPSDIELGLSSDEVTARMRVIRSMTTGGDLLYKEINKLNEEIEEEVIKK